MLTLKKYKVFFPFGGANSPLWAFGEHALNPLPLDLSVLHYKVPVGEHWKEIFRCLRPGSTGYEMIGRIVACYRRSVDTEVLDADDHERA